MTKLVQNDIASLTNEQSALAALNSNYASLEVFSDSVLSRDGTSPNQMNADLDMNGNQILNLPAPATATEPLRLQDLSSFIGGGTITAGVSHPSSSTDNALTRWDGTGGSAIQNSNATLSDLGALTSSSTAEHFAQNNAIIHRLSDRLLISGAAVNDGAFPNVTKDWLTTFQVAAGLSSGSIVAATSAVLTHPTNAGAGQAFVAGAQTLNFASAGPTALGCSGYSLNNNASFATNAWAFYGEAHHTSAVAGSSYGMELDPRATVATITPTPFQQGNVIGIQLAAGAGLSAVGQFDISAAIQLAPNPMKFKKGFVFGDTALTAGGGGGNGIAIELSRNQSIRWLNSGATTDSELWGNASGLNTAQVINSTAEFKSTMSVDFAIPFQATSTNASANAGPYILLFRNSASPAANDLIGAFLWQAKDSGGNTFNAISLDGSLLDPTDGSEDTQLGITVVTAGTTAAAMTIGNGVQIGAPTGGYQGGGTLNLDNALFKDGTQVVNSRVTGYTAFTGTNTNRATAYDTATITLVQLAERVRALQVDLTAHGLIGA